MSENAGPLRRNSFLALLPFLIFGAIAAVFYYQLSAGPPSKLPSAMIGRKAPEFSLPAVPGLIAEGRLVPGFATRDLAIGKPILLNVFASWCAPCHEEHPLLMELAKDSRILIYGLNYKDQPDNARRFLGARGNPYAAVGVDPAGRAAIDFGVYGVPETFLISGDGTIAYKLVGQITPENVRAALLPEIEKALRR